MAFCFAKFIITQVTQILKRAKTHVSRRPDLYLSFALFVAAFLLYWRTMPPTILEGDSGEFQYMAYILGVPHSSGYPLYILLGKLFTYLPFGDPAWRVNLLSVVSAALTVPLVYAVARRLIGCRAPSVLAALVIAATPSMWGGALETKTYALHLFLGVLSVLLALRWHQDRRTRDFYWLAVVYGLGLANHHVIVFLAPALAFVVWINRDRLNRAMLARAALLAVLPLLLYAYIPLRANYWISQQDPANWQLYTREDAMLKGTVSEYYRNSLDGFLNLITGFDNAYKIKSPLDDNRMMLVTTLLLQQFGWVGIGLTAVGAVVSFRRERKHFGFVLLIALGIGTIATVLRGLSAVYYFSLAYFALALWLGFGVDAVMRWSSRVHRALPAALGVVMLALPASAVAANYTSLDESGNYAAREYAQAVLNDDLAPNAVLAAPWEVSEPVRYLQFVENQRPDVLVVHLDPTARQFETMLKNANALNRPFYSVQFDPELATAPGPRLVQAIPLPLYKAPQPQHPLTNARLAPEVQVLGYDVEPDPPQPGKPARVIVYYRADARMYPMYSATLRLTDILGHEWIRNDGFPGSFYFPTYRWYELGQYYRDTWALDLPADAPNGLYNLDLSWDVYDLETRKPDYAHEFKVSLGTLRVGNLNGGPIAHAQSVPVGTGITFLGWDSRPYSTGQSVSVARGQPLGLDLYWRADSAADQSYTVFVHLIDSTGKVVSNADSPPSQGLYPTNRWNVGETVRDPHTLQIPSSLTPGDYSVEIGMYLASTGARLAIGATDRIVITQVHIY